MANIKLNKKIDNKDFDVIPDIPVVEEVYKEKNNSGDNEETFIKTEEVETRKLFANKKANIALGVLAGLIILAIVAATVYVNV